MLKLRPGNDRGTTAIDWLYSRHSFSFGDYYDPQFHHYRSLRVINDDVIAGGGGFPIHPHRDMEILTYVMAGQLQHRDSMGNGTVIHPGEWQKMSAGTGIYHSEFNPSASEAVHLLQIWIMPSRKGLKPEYDQKHFGEEQKRGQWKTIASQDGRDGSIVVHQDVLLLSTLLEPGESRDHPMTPGRSAWLQVASGSVTVNGQQLQAGDAIAIEDEPVTVTGTTKSEVLLFDLV